MMSMYNYYLINVGCGTDYNWCGCKSERFGEILWETLIQSDIVRVKYIVVFIYMQFITVHYSIVRVLYIQPKVWYIVHVVTGIFILGCAHLQIVLVQFDNNVICKD